MIFPSKREMHPKHTHSLAKANSSGDRMEGSPSARDFSFSRTWGKNFSIWYGNKTPKTVTELSQQFGACSPCSPASSSALCYRWVQQLGTSLDTGS